MNGLACVSKEWRAVVGRDCGVVWDLSMKLPTSSIDITLKSCFSINLCEFNNYFHSSL